MGIMPVAEFTDSAQMYDMIKKAADSLYSVKATRKGKYIFV